MDIMEDLYTTTFSNNEAYFKKAAAEIGSLRAQIAELKAENERLSIRSERNADDLADSRMFCDMKKIECRQLQEERDELTRQRDELLQARKFDSVRIDVLARLVNAAWPENKTVQLECIGTILGSVRLVVEGITEGEAE